jgi:hypothetical protein
VYYFSLRIFCLKRRERKVLSTRKHDKISRKNYCQLFMENSSIQGCNQVVMKKRHWIERVIWFFLVCVAIYFCSSTTKDFFMKYRNAPVMMKYEDSIGSLEEIPFPAITFNNELYLSYRNNMLMKFYDYGKPDFEFIIEEIGYKLGHLF